MMGQFVVGEAEEAEIICSVGEFGSELAGSAEWFSWGVWGEGLGHGCDDIYYLSAASQGVWMSAGEGWLLVPECRTSRFANRCAPAEFALLTVMI